MYSERWEGELRSQRKITNEFFQRDMILKWRSSGLSQAEFCRREGLAEQQLSNWKRREERKRDLVARQAKLRESADRKAKRRAAKELYWRALVEEHAASGLSLREFCARKRISVNTCKRWRQELLGIEEQVLAASRATSTNPFMQVVVTQPAEESAAEDGEIEILLPGGAKVVATAHTSTDLLTKLFKALKESTC